MQGRHANLPGASILSAFDYGFVDFQENGIITEDLRADFVNLTFPKSDVISNYGKVMGSPEPETVRDKREQRQAFF